MPFLHGEKGKNAGSRYTTASAHLDHMSTGPGASRQGSQNIVSTILAGIPVEYCKRCPTPMAGELPNERHRVSAVAPVELPVLNTTRYAACIQSRRLPRLLSMQMSVVGTQ